MNVAQAFAEFQRIHEWQQKMDRYRCTLSNTDLKKLWDSFDENAGPNEPGYFWPKDSPHIEDVHFLLNERGEGAYCAV